MKALQCLLIFTMAFVVSYQSAAQSPALGEQLAKARELVQQGNTTEASRVYTDLMGVYPGNKDVVREWLMLNMKRTPTGEEEGIGQLGELGKTYPKNTAILFWQMFIQAEYKHFDDALKNAEKLTSLQPDSAINWLAKGQILEGMNKLDEAMNAYEKATLLGPGNADAWQNKAGLLVKTSRFDEAIDAYTKAIQLAPKVAPFVYNRGCAYCLKGDKANALADLTKAVSLDPRLKTHAPKDTDFKNLWEDADFKRIVTEDKYSSVPNITADQKHGRTLFQCWVVVAAGANYAKTQGTSPYEYGKYLGKLFAPTWGAGNDYEKLVKGMIYNLESFRHASDAPLVVKENADGSVSIRMDEKMIHKYLPEGNPFLDFKEFLELSRGLYEAIADYMGATFTSEITGTKMINTYTKK